MEQGSSYHFYATNGSVVILWKMKQGMLGILDLYILGDKVYT